MGIDFAPLEGITGALFRQLHHEYFPGIDRYYTPFISPTSDRRFTPKEQREILPQYNEGLCLVPQLLTKNPEDFIWAASELYAMGYSQINLNAGCPSGTVTAKGKGSGMLADLSALRVFLDEIFSRSPCKISIKTRLGLNDPEEFLQILSLYEDYPMTELIIHPRVRKDFYRHPVRTEAFDLAYRTTSLPLTYNGSIATVDDHNACCSQWPKLHSVMIGQGLVSDPFLACKIRFGAKADKSALKEFHDRLLDGYTTLFQSRNNAAQRMKEIWIYLLCSFENSAQYKKQLLKTRNADDYLLIVQKIFSELSLLPHSTAQW